MTTLSTRTTITRHIRYHHASNIPHHLNNNRWGLMKEFNTHRLEMQMRLGPQVCSFLYIHILLLFTVRLSYGTRSGRRTVDGELETHLRLEFLFFLVEGIFFPFVLCILILIFFPYRQPPYHLSTQMCCNTQRKTLGSDGDDKDGDVKGSRCVRRLSSSGNFFLLPFLHY
jgi:hypothetical protein